MKRWMVLGFLMGLLGTVSAASNQDFDSLINSECVSDIGDSVPDVSCIETVCFNDSDFDSSDDTDTEETACLAFGFMLDGIASTVADEGSNGECAWSPEEKYDLDAALMSETSADEPDSGRSSVASKTSTNSQEGVRRSRRKRPLKPISEEDEGNARKKARPRETLVICPHEGCGAQMQVRSLYRHMKIHNESRTMYKAPCGYSATQKSNVVRHLQLKHESVLRECDRAKYRCSVAGCSYKTTDKKTLDVHVKACEQGLSSRQKRPQCDFGDFHEIIEGTPIGDMITKVEVKKS